MIPHVEDKTLQVIPCLRRFQNGPLLRLHGGLFVLQSCQQSRVHRRGSSLGHLHRNTLGALLHLDNIHPFVLGDDLDLRLLGGRFLAHLGRLRRGAVRTLRGLRPAVLTGLSAGWLIRSRLFPIVSIGHRHITLLRRRPEPILAIIPVHRGLRRRFRRRGLRRRGCRRWDSLRTGLPLGWRRRTGVSSVSRGGTVAGVLDAVCLLV
mmetsp:Transcript_47153/g.102625  ORF Transcript_47153/g.102625 Transcript_47153/m.102625 type:complete len:206 (+) Transcript_47153:900-1517(+)